MQEVRVAWLTVIFAVSFSTWPMCHKVEPPCDQTYWCLVGNMGVHHRGLIFPYSLLRTSKHSSAVSSECIARG